MKIQETPFMNLAKLHFGNQSEVVETANILNLVCIKSLQEMRSTYTQVPLELSAKEQLLKDIISSTAVYLAETNNWYGNFTK